MRCLALVTSLLVAQGVGCADFDRPPPPGPPAPGTSDGGNFFDPPDARPPDPDAPWLCGSLVVPLVTERPNLYFIVDVSGSMAQELEPPIPNASTLYQAARLAIADLLRIVGHRVQFGAAIFPGKQATEAEPCPSGREVFATRAGDSASHALSGKTGPVLEGLMATLANQVPGGTTPTAATIRALSPTLRDLSGETFVLLITDGAPNCNPLAECTSATCEHNLAGRCQPASANCCDPTLVGPFANLSCLDATSTAAALGDLHDDGISTYVIGLPGTRAFAEVLDQLAVAGGTARPTAPLYYSVDRAEDIGWALKEIGSEAVISCEIQLSEAPPDPALVNVYLDRELLPRGESTGWRWVNETVLEIVGDGCDLLKQGDVLQVQVAAGCPTVVR